MRYCKKCVQPDTRPGIEFDESGVCLACNYNEEVKNKINWEERQRELREIASWAKQNSKGLYDAVIGVSGGKDSTFQAVYAKEKLGLNVLLVNGVPNDLTEVGSHNIENLISLGFDAIKMVPNPKIMKKNIKRSFYEYGNPLKPMEYTLWASAFIIAEKFNIPLVIQGENPALTLGVAKEGMKKDGDALNVLSSNTLKGCNASDWVTDEIAFKELLMYQFPDLKELEKKNIKSISLQYYTKEWSQGHNADFAMMRGLITRDRESSRDLGRVKKYNALDSDVGIVNQMIKYYKFGFGAVTDEVCYDIREGKMSREDALQLVEEYDGKCGQQYIDKFCKYIDITSEEFWDNIDKFVNKELFTKNKVTNRWEPKFTVGEDYDELSILR